MERDPIRETTGKADKRPLWHRLYFSEVHTEVARIVGYAGFPQDQLEEKLKDIVERFGRKKIQEVCSELITLHFKGKEKPSGRREDAEVRLKEDVRKLCWQLLGPPPEKKAEFERRKYDIPAKETSPNEATAPVKAEPSPKKPRQKKAASKQEPAPKTTKTPRDTPIMTQYREAKEKHPGMILIFRMGDFYEAFDDDSETLHKVLGLTLTTRDQAIPMAGFPHHQLEAYLHKLLKAGLRVAVCDQVEESLARGPIKREVQRVEIPEEDGDPE